jgi:type II secretory pathway pseudopilin PulG
VRPKHAKRSALTAECDEGTTIVELLAALTVIALATTLAVPATASILDRAAARHAAAFVAAALRSARAHAVRTHRATALVFDERDGRWTFRVCADDNGNGVRHADLSSGSDHCLGGPIDIGRRFPHTAIAVDAAVNGPDDTPAGADPVRFGASDMASFSPVGSATPGTLFLQSAGGAQYAVRVGNMTGRTRVLRFDAGTAQWRSQ